MVARDQCEGRLLGQVGGPRAGEVVGAEAEQRHVGPAVPEGGRAVVREDDVVVVMDDGRIIERGRPDELRSAGGVHARLWAAWSRGTG